VPYGVPKHITVLRDGDPTRIEYLENDHCCQRFVLVDDWLRARRLQREGTVGNGVARLARSRDVVEIVGERLRADPLVFLHPWVMVASSATRHAQHLSIGLADKGSK
jgi:aminoglycoside N3'-acetyltransferase